MAHGVTSEWEDAHVKLGNWEAREKETPQYVLNQEAQDKAEQIDPLAKKDIEELKEMEDDFEDEFLEKYKQLRLEEIKAQSQKPQYEGLREISKQDYVNEVTNAPKGVYVLLHLHQDYVEPSERLGMILYQLSKNYPTYKFLKIKADRCIENFPDVKVPTLIIYKDGDLKHNVVRIDKETKVITYASIEKFLKKIAVFPKTEDDDDEEEDQSKFMLRRNFVDRDADRSDSDEDDRGYSNTTFKKI